MFKVAEAACAKLGRDDDIRFLAQLAGRHCLKTNQGLRNPAMRPAAPTTRASTNRPKNEFVQGPDNPIAAAVPWVLGLLPLTRETPTVKN